MGPWLHLFETDMAPCRMPFPPLASFKSRCVPSSRQFQKQVCAGKDEEEGDKKQVVANKFGRFVTLAGRTNNKNIFVQKNNYNRINLVDCDKFTHA